jgi:hypothetical protein
MDNGQNCESYNLLRLKLHCGYKNRMLLLQHLGTSAYHNGSEKSKTTDTEETRKPLYIYTLMLLEIIFIIYI